MSARNLQEFSDETTYTVKTAQVNLHEKAGKFACGPQIIRPHMRFTCSTNDSTLNMPANRIPARTT